MFNNLTIIFICIYLHNVDSQACDEVEDFINWDINSIVTPIKIDRFQHLLWESKYNVEESNFLIHGFCHGFSIEYQGPHNRRNKSKNIPFCNGIGSDVELWRKIMKEVKLKRYAGPFAEKEIPFKYFIQSPLGLVPKGDQGDTRLIFHLSYKFPDGSASINAWTPTEKCSVKYYDLDFAVQASLHLLLHEKDGTSSNAEVIWYSKSGLKSAFRILGIRLQDWPFLMMCAKHPVTGNCSISLISAYHLDPALVARTSRDSQMH